MYTASLARAVPQSAAPPVYEELGPLTMAGGGGLSWSEIHNQEEEATVTVHPENLTPDIKAALRSLFDGDPANVPWLELWITRHLIPVHRGRIILPNWTQTEMGLLLTLNSRGPLYELRSMWVRILLDYRGGLIEDQHQIVVDLIDQWQNLAFGNLGIDTSAVTASGVDREIHYDPAEEHNVHQRVLELATRINGFDVWVELETGPEARVLNLGTRGADLTDTVVLDRRGLADTGLAVSLTAGDLASEAFGASHDPAGTLASTFSDTALRAAIGRRGIAGTFAGISVQATLDDYTEAMQVTRALPMITPQPQLIPVAGADEVAFGAGDIVQFVPDLGIDEGDERVVLNRRVLAKRVTVGDNGNVAIGVEYF